VRERFINKTFNDEALELIEECDAVIEKYVEAGYELTVRQLYYQMIARDLFPDSWIDYAYNHRYGLDGDTKNTQKNYKRFAGLVSDARLAGLLDWEAIVDRVRATVTNPHYRDVDHLLKVAVNWFEIDKRSDQPVHLEVMCEKDAVAGILEPVASRWDLPFTACRGYASQSLFYRIGKRLEAALDGGQAVAILYFGDHDPSGLDMDRDIRKRLAQFAHYTPDSLTFIRLALTAEQIREYASPPNPAKVTDSRAKAYIELHGRESWELDALDPDVLVGLLDRMVRRIQDNGLWRAAVEREKELVSELKERVGYDAIERGDR